jgi:hypothetical protein
MVELATPVAPVRQAPRTTERDQWIGAGRALAGEIWGINYAGTIPSYGVPVRSPSTVFAEGTTHPGNISVVVGAHPTTVVVSSPSVEDLYWHAFRRLTSEIGVNVWEGECLFSLPARTAPSEPDLLFWTSEGLGASSILILGEAKLSRTDPAEESNAPRWRRIFEAHLPGRPESIDRQLAAIRDVYSELRTLIEWTRLPVEQFGELVGASRRTMYNWLAGRPIRDEAQSRIFRLRDAIADVADSRDPALVRAWLLSGDPSPATLVIEERWDEFEARVREETAPLRPLDQETQQTGEEPQAETREVLNAVLSAFSSTSSRTRAPRPAWKPHEVTGIQSEDEEDPE